MSTVYIFNKKRFYRFADLVNEFYSVKGHYPAKSTRIFGNRILFYK